ncbi:MAG TPA: ArsR family transcriptional regulator [Candidatus Aenigmarchaeota archaeon]|nr:ArsR family transcriptional regulator [Candidatus Aenigmarchaeota archaeon]
MRKQEQKEDKINTIFLNLKRVLICSNPNRISILHLLAKSPNYEMQTEKIASILGISHRTALYHLDLLHEYGIVEVRRYRKRGSRLMRSVWGLKLDNFDEIESILKMSTEMDTTRNNKSKIVQPV